MRRVACELLSTDADDDLLVLKTEVETGEVQDEVAEGKSVCCIQQTARRFREN